MMNKNKIKYLHKDKTLSDNHKKEVLSTLSFASFFGEFADLFSARQISTNRDLLAPEKNKKKK